MVRGGGYSPVPVTSLKTRRLCARATRKNNFENHGSRSRHKERRRRQKKTLKGWLGEIWTQAGGVGSGAKVVGWKKIAVFSWFVSKEANTILEMGDVTHEGLKKMNLLRVHERWLWWRNGITPWTWHSYCLFGRSNKQLISKIIKYISKNNSIKQN